MKRYCWIILTVVLTVGLLSSNAAAEEPTAPAPYSGEHMSYQALGGAATGAGMMLGAGGLLYAISRPEDPPPISGLAIAGALVLIGSTPLAVPIPVNHIGNNRGYSDQYLGAHLGGLVGAAAGAGTAMSIRSALDSSSGVGGAFAVSGSYVLGATLGSVLGYHVQAGLRQSDHSSQAQMSPFVSPSIDSATNERTITAGWQGRF